MDPYDIIYHPFVTEKTMSFMENNNALEFVVKRNTNKKIIKKAIEQMFDVKVKKINTRITKTGKHAIVVFMPEVKAEDIGMRIGIF
jgi:large subunit ribosomal protein L23